MTTKRVTKTKDTQLKYFSRATSLIKKAYEESKEVKNKRFNSTSYYKDLDGETFIGLDIYTTSAFFKLYWSDLSQSTIRAYRSSLIFYSEVLLKNKKITKDEYVKTVKLLKSINSSKPNNVKNTSAKKQKHLTPKDLKFLDGHLRDSKTKWSKPLRVWLRAGILTGLRPVEWRDAEYNGETNTLIVKNAKNTNGRANGYYRNLNLNHLDKEDINIIKQQLILSKKFNSAGLWDDYYNGCSNLMRYLCRKIWPNRKKRPTLYSTRHQYCANLKASGLRIVEIASLMGHATDETASETYGRKVVGTKVRKPEVNQEELVNVKVKFDDKYKQKLKNENNKKEAK